jgi:tripartite-type tricarboxylate transporter receptor subunit TctC
MKKAALALALTFAAAVAARAENAATPPSTIRVVVPNPPGGAMDSLIRVLAERIKAAHGASVVVDNRPGASTIIGSDIVARAPPDGGTLLMAANSFLVNPHIRALPFDPLTSFAGVCELVEIPQVIAVNARKPWKRLADLVAAAKENPGRMTIGSNGPATAQHVVAEVFRRAAGIDMVYVPYPGGVPAVNALMGEQIDAMTTAFSDLHAQWEAGALRVLVMSLAKRTPLAPDIPTFREEGFAFDLPSWLGLHAPANTPAPVRATLERWFSEALNAPETKPLLANMQMAGVGLCGAPFDAFLRQQYDGLGKIVREAGIKAE